MSQKKIKLNVRKARKQLRLQSRVTMPLAQWCIQTQKRFERRPWCWLNRWFGLLPPNPPVVRRKA